MRLNETEKKVLIDAIHAHDPSASVWLFGSRVDDQKKAEISMWRSNPSESE